MHNIEAICKTVCKSQVKFSFCELALIKESLTSFGVELSTLGSDLMWDEGAHIAQCKSNNRIPYSLDIIGSETFDCNQQPGSTTCASEETGGTNGGVYPDCEFTNWPWVGNG